MKLASTIALILALGACAATAQESPRWILRAGVHPIQPKPHHHSQLHVGDGAAVSFAATYMFNARWGVEALAALPIEHEATLPGSGNVATIKQIPPTLSLQYHFLDPNGRVRAYIGAGVNRTTFFDEHTAGTWADADLRLGDSWGPAALAGLDFDIGRAWFVSIDARWFDIDTAARLNGASLGTIELDPYALGMTIGRRLR